MKVFINNKTNLEEKEITQIVKRVKVLLINDKNEILLGYSHNTYQFPGGHVEDNESLDTAVIREIKEETGITFTNNIPFPIATFYGYYQDWPQKGENRKTEIYYYEVKCNEMPDLEKTSYTKEEVDGHFELRYIPLKDVLFVLENHLKQYPECKGITEEMLSILNCYLTSKK